MLRSIVFVVAIIAAADGFQLSNPLRTVQSASSVCQRVRYAAASASPKQLRMPIMKLPAVNTQAPTFNLPDAKGKLVGLDNFKGKWTVLYFCEY